MMQPTIFSQRWGQAEKAGGKITDIFFCPHVPDEGCSCRKPLPGMILDAVFVNGIDLVSFWMAGDSFRDILAGKHAGCGNTGLVFTGNGETALSELSEKNQLPDHVAEDLWDMAQWITGQR